MLSSITFARGLSHFSVDRKETIRRNVLFCSVNIIIIIGSEKKKKKKKRISLRVFYKIAFVFIPTMQTQNETIILGIAGALDNNYCEL